MMSLSRSPDIWGCLETLLASQIPLPYRLKLMLLLIVSVDTLILTLDAALLEATNVNCSKMENSNIMYKVDCCVKVIGQIESSLYAIALPLAFQLGSTLFQTAGPAACAG